MAIGHPATAAGTLARKGAVRIGAHSVEALLVDFVEIFPVANVGDAFLRRFAVTIDQKSHRIRFRA